LTGFVTNAHRDKYNNNPLVPGLNIQNHHNLFPTPQSQIDLNIDIEFGQNFGY